MESELTDQTSAPIESNTILTVEPKETLSDVIDLSFDIPVPAKEPIRKEYTLKQNSWHAKLMENTWNLRTRDFTHMCPYFWLSVLNILLIPYTFLIKLPIKWIVRSITEVSLRLKYKKEYALSEEHKAFCEDINVKLKNKTMTLEQVAGLPDDMYLVYRNSLDYGDLYFELIAKRRKYNDGKMLSERERKQKINKVLSKFKWIATITVNLLTTALIALGCYIVYGIIKYLIDNYNYTTALNYGFMFGVFGVAALLVFGFMLALRDHEEITLKVLRIVFYPVVILFVGIVTLIDLVATMYSDNCPPINWK